MFFKPQFCVCGITGGYGGAGVKTAVPTGARAKIDITIVPDQEPGEIVAQIRSHLDAAGFADVRADHPARRAHPSPRRLTIRSSHEP